MHQQPRRVLVRRTIGWVLMWMGAIGFALSLVGFLDPVGSKMADDNDPFGPPIPRSDSAVGMAAGVVLAGIGAWLTRVKWRPPAD